MWNYVATAHKPTAVEFSVTGNFTSPTDINLIVSKGTRLEIHTVTPEGTQLILDTPINGRVATMETFRMPNETIDYLFISTEKHKFCILAYEAQSGRLVTKANGDLQDRIGRPVEANPIVIIDPLCRVIALHLYDGLLKIVQLEQSGDFRIAGVFNLRIEELQVIDIKFLHRFEKAPTIAILYQDNKEKRHVKTYSVSVKDKELREGPWSTLDVEDGASLLISVPLGGCLVVGEKSIVHQSQSGPTSISMKPGVFEAVGKVDVDGSRFLLGDEKGNLFVLVLSHENRKVTDLKLELLGETSVASTISYLDNGYVFIGSAYGDSQLVKLNKEKDEETGSYLEIIESYTNLGPIVDFCVVDLDQQGQGQIVTCSGAFKDGTIRIIRNGIGINEQAAVELPGIKGVWSMKSTSDATFDTFLAVSFIAETKVLSIAGEELEETQIPGFLADAQTLYCGNAIADQLLQVTPGSVRLVNGKSLALVNEWTVPAGAKIASASANTSQILLAIGGGNLVYLEIQGDKLQEVSRITTDHDISCVNINAFNGQEKAKFAAIGLWDVSLRILSLPSLKEVNKEQLGGDVIGRSVLFASFEGTNYLLCGLGDGHLFTFIIDENTAALSDKKKISIGTQAISLVPFTSKNVTNIFASSDRPTVIYSANKKLSCSNVNLKAVNYVCPFNTENFPDSLTIINETTLTVGTIDEIQKLHVQTIPLGGAMGWRICYQESTHTFAVPIEQQQATPDGEITESHYVRLLNDQTFDVLHSFALKKYENVCSIISCKFDEDPQNYFVVGTAFIHEQDPDPNQGRILILQVKDNKLLLVYELDVQGAAYALEPFNGKLLATVNNKILLLRWVISENGDGSHTLKIECSHKDHVLAQFLTSRGDFIAVGDLMRSIGLFNYDANTNGIVEIARDFSPNWMSAIEIVDEDTFIAAEGNNNLFTVRRHSDAPTDEERAKLEPVGEFHLGEHVNRFRHGSLVMKNTDSESKPIPTILFTTVSGAIGIVASITKDQYMFFLRLQQAIAQVVPPVGGLDHSQFRMFKTQPKSCEARNFIDGDLIESFLDLKRETMEEICAKLGDVTIEEITKNIETIAQSIH